MTLAQAFISAAIVALILVSFLHSYFGEKRLLVPLFKHRGNAVLESDLARLVLRFAWHLTSLLWVLMAMVLYAAAFQPATLLPTVLLTSGLGFLFVGLFGLLLNG